MAQVLCQIDFPMNQQVLVGMESSDDAGVYELNAETALVQTVDFFTPIVDDPYAFGQIAAANALSDVYAMGAKPITALNIVTFPLQCLPLPVLGEILRGGADKVREAGAVLFGGHTVEDQEPKYGLSVTGIVHPKRVWRNNCPQTGDGLVLTKALGTGLLATAYRADCFTAEFEQATQQMARLNKEAYESAVSYEVHACTDITGFGFLGHLQEMVTGSRLSAEIWPSTLPLLPGAIDAARMGLVPAGAYHNRNHLKNLELKAELEDEWVDVLTDPQTSGGLLLSLPWADAEELVQKLQSKMPIALVGRILPDKEEKVIVR